VLTGETFFFYGQLKIFSKNVVGMGSSFEKGVVMASENTFEKVVVMTNNFF
jgi:hypothetical protein